MLGPQKHRHFDRQFLVSLENLVPPDNFYRYLDAKLDLSFVREWVQDSYAARGRPSIDPVVFFKLQLIMFFDGIRSERKLIDTASLHLAHRWYVGYNLDEPLPDHSSLTRIRQRLGLPVFERFFEQVVKLCQEAGLVWGKEVFIDATKVRANADIDSLAPRFAQQAKAHLQELFSEGQPESPPSEDEVLSVSEGAAGTGAARTNVGEATSVTPLNAVKQADAAGFDFDTVIWLCRSSGDRRVSVVRRVGKHDRFV